MYCGKCGKKILDDVAFCPNCGAPVAVKPTPQQKISRPSSENTAEKTKGGVAKFFKNKLFFVLLVLVLGAAVYLGWQFLGTNKLPAGEDTSSTVSQSGAAQFVNSASAETASDKLESSSSKSDSADAIFEARRKRQSSRDAAMALLDEALKNVDEDSAGKGELVEQAADIAQDILKETNAEKLLQAKGYEEAVVYVDGENCSVVVAGKLEDADMLIIQEIVMDQTGFSADKITITGTE